MTKRRAIHTRWMFGTILGGVLVATMVGGVLHYEGIERVAVTGQSIILVHLQALPTDPTRPVLTGYFQCGVTAWGTHWGRGCQYYRRGAMEAEECCGTYELPRLFHR